MKNREIEKDEINKITEQCKPREKAFFTVMRQSGLPPHTIKQLKIKNLERILEPDTPIPCRIKKSNVGSPPDFIGREAVKYLKQYLRARTLRARTKLTLESLLFTTYNNPNKEINTKDVSRAFKVTAQELEIKKKITYEVKKGKPSELRLYSLIKFYRKNAKGYLTELHNKNTPKDDEFYRKLYEEEAMPNLEIELQTPIEIYQLEKRQQKEIEKRDKQIEELQKLQKLQDQRLSYLEEKIPNVEKLEQALKISIAKITGNQPEEYRIEWTDKTRKNPKKG